MVGDLLQLPSNKAPQIFELHNNEFGEYFNLWSLFAMVKLTEMMQQIEDKNFINILNNIYIGKCSEENVKQLQLRKIPIESVHPDATFLFAGNSPKDDYNASKIGQLNYLERKNRIY